MSTKSVRSRARSYTKGLMSKKTIDKVINNGIAGILTGAIQQKVPNDALWGYADSIVPIGVGAFMDNDTLITLGSYQVGIKLAAQLTGGGTVNVGGAY